MPFHKRTVNPQRLCRFNGETFAAERSCHDDGTVENSKVLNPPSFTSLEDVNCQAFTSILFQLSDLSQHATCIFAEIQTEAASLVYRAGRLQLRLDSLQKASRLLDHRKIKLRELTPLFQRYRLFEIHHCSFGNVVKVAE